MAFPGNGGKSFPAVFLHKAEVPLNWLFKIVILNIKALKSSRKMISEEQEEDIKKLEGDVNNTMLLALDGDEIVGIATISSSHKIKSRHEGELGIVVAKKYQGQGIGSRLIEMLIDWCKGNGVTTRIRLDTRTDNTMAVSLYLKFGFVVEGCLRNQTLLNGKYYDLYIMGMMIK